MQVKTIIGESLPDALVKAKQQYGNDIILLESKELKGKNGKAGKKLVQVSISVEEENRNVRPWTPPSIKVEREKKVETVKPDNGQNDFNNAISDILNRRTKEMDQEKKILEELAALRQEITQLQQKKDATKDAFLPEMFTQFKTLLMEKGVNDKLADYFIKRVYRLLSSEKKVNPRDVLDGLKAEMNRLFDPYTFANGNEPAKQKIILLLGATGVGKSTTAMKIAAHPDLFGKKDAVIISTDPYGPSEALKAFSKMNGTTVFEARNSDEIMVALEKFSSKEVIIVDTPGQSPFAPNHLSKLEEYVKAFKPTDIFLVLSMNTDLKDLFLSCALYLLLKPTGIAFTKFDETTQPGKVFSILEELNLPVVCYGEGKRIFIDVAAPSIDYMFDKIFETA